MSFLTDDGLNKSFENLETLCRSMTEHALEGKKFDRALRKLASPVESVFETSFCNHFLARYHLEP